MRQPVTPALLHDLVVGSHAEGTTRLASGAVIEHENQILLVETDYCWQLPGDLVLPGEDLLDAVHRTAAAAGIDLDHIAGYLGHHDLLLEAGLVRTFVFAATPRPGRACHSTTVSAPYRWADIDDLPDSLAVDVLAFIHAPRVTAHDPDQAQLLSAGLRSHARGLLAAEAAIELLVGHRLWLRRTDFIDDYVETVSTLRGDIPMACVNWPAAITALDNGSLPCSSGEDQMLRLAASLADGIPVDLRDALTRLDSDNLDLLIQAALHTGGR